MVHADGAPSGGPGGGGTDFEGFTLEQLQAMIAQAKPSALGAYAEKLHGTAQRIQTATLGLSQSVQALSGVWEGPSAESFRTWAGGLTAAATGLGDYVSAAGTHINHVGQQLVTAQSRMPRVAPTVLATANQGPVAVVSKAVTNQATGGNPGGVDPIKAQQDAKAQVDAAHREAVTQMRTLASTYRVAATDLKALPAPVFPDPPASIPINRTTSLDGVNGSGGGGSSSANGHGRNTSNARSGSGGSGTGIYSAPLGQPSGSSQPGSATPGGAPPYVPQSTDLQGNGSLTAPSTLDRPWMPQISGDGPGTVAPPGTNPPGALPAGVPIIPKGSEPAITPNSGGRRSGGGPGNTSPRGGGVGPGPAPSRSGVPGSTPRGGGVPGVGGGRGAFSALPETRGPASNALGGTTGSGPAARTGGMPGVAGAPGSPTGRPAGAPGRRLAASQGGSVGNASGAASNRSSPRLQALPAEPGAAGSGDPGIQRRASAPGERTPFTGGTRSEQVRRRTPRVEDEDDNIWDGPRRPGVVPPVIE
ncbi:uncharacterized protein YukE [Embleya sp. AB8]